MNNLLRDFLHSFRQLRRSPGFAAVAVITLALGIGATTAIYSILYATLFEPMPYADPDRLVMVWSISPAGERNVVFRDDFVAWKQASTVFEDLNAIASGYSLNLAGSERPERVQVQASTPGFFPMQGLPFLLGRNFRNEEGIQGNDHVAILTYALWQKLGSDAGIIGKPLKLDGESRIVVGVLAPGPLDGSEQNFGDPLIVVPLCMTSPEHRWSMVMGRLKTGVSLAQAQAEMNAIAQRLEKERPHSNKGWHVSVERLHTDFLPVSTKVTLWLLLAAVGLVLLIACVNIANLLLGRSIVRQPEVAVRISLGAPRRRILAQFLIESLTIAMLGAAAGVALAAVLIKLTVAILPQNALPIEANVRISIPVLLFTLVVAIAVGVLSGCAPALRGSHLSPNQTLKNGGNTGRSRSATFTQGALVIAEFGLALTLLTAAGLSIHSFWKLVHVNLGVRTDHVLTFTVPVTERRFATPERMVLFYQELLDKIKALPGVTSAQLSTGFPVEERPWWGQKKEFLIFGEGIQPKADWHQAAIQAMTPEYFDTFGLQLLKGRRLSDQDTLESLPVAVVNEEFARRFSRDSDPLGHWIVMRKFAPFSNGPWPMVKLQIVGVYRNVKNSGMRSETVPEIDLPFWQAPSPDARMAVRTAGDPRALTRVIATTLASMQSDLPLADVKTMDDVVSDASARDRFSMVLYGMFGFLALMLAAVGIYGVMAFQVAQRTREIGVRMAVGADRRQVVGMVLRKGLALVGCGLVLGSFGALLVSLILRSMLYGMEGINFAVLATVSGTLLAAAMLGCYFPARRAAKVDPISALRCE
jgi:putative ABC transport system permease protein